MTCYPRRVSDSDARSHWDSVYRRKGADEVSWFQPNLSTSLSFIDNIGLPPTARVIDVGGGASTLVDDLLGRGFHNLAVLDLSGAALAASRDRLQERGLDTGSIEWIEADITHVDLGENRYDLWHDRAVFHFLTDPAARAAYVATAARALKPSGHIIVATFGPEGPERCSGLDVVRYDPDGIHDEFGDPFVKVRSAEESHQTPWGSEQEFVYCWCQRAG